MPAPWRASCRSPPITVCSPVPAISWCDDEQRQRMAVLCKDADGVDRRQVHRSLQSETAAFFSQALGAPEPAERSAAVGDAP